FNHGQNCSAGSRIFVQESIYGKFLDQFTEQAHAIKVGDPFSPDTYQGPQVYASTLIIKHTLTSIKRIMGYITSGKNDGATLHLGGKQIHREGYFIKPTIFMECQPDMKIVREEIFGPVVCIMKFNTKDGEIVLMHDHRTTLEKRQKGVARKVGKWI
ncbi:aldehyde dehydrogenase domain-containing protein, partial [Suillus discolor]